MRERLVEALSARGFDYPVEFFPTLKYVMANRGATQFEIAVFLVRDKATVARLLSKMEDELLIERKVDPQNRRQKLVSLTKKGEKAFEVATECATQLTQLAVKGICTQDQKTCQHVLQRVFANLNTITT